MDEKVIMKFQMMEKIGRLLKLSREKKQVVFKETAIRMAPCFSSVMMEDSEGMLPNYL